MPDLAFITSTCVNVNIRGPHGVTINIRREAEKKFTLIVLQGYRSD